MIANDIHENSIEKPLTFVDTAKEMLKNAIDFAVDHKIEATSAVEYPGIIQKIGMTNKYVRLIKDRLVALGYLTKSTHSTFGKDTQNAIKSFQRVHGITVDGMVGIETWRKLFGEDTEGVKPVDQISYTDTWTRVLTIGMSGNDVYEAKKRLHDLGYLSACTKATFGQDTYQAVIWMQTTNGLSPTGMIDKATWDVLFSEDCKKPEKAEIVIPAHISQEVAQNIKTALEQTTEVRRKIVLDLLQYAIDPNNPGAYPKAFYVRGGNMYNTRTYALNIMTKAKLESYLNKAAYKSYTDGGRAEMMRAAGMTAGYTQPGADCSGMVVGVLAKFAHDKTYKGVKKTVASGFDANANTLIAKYANKTTNIRPGTLCHKAGHIGIAVSPVYCVESAGGSYGWQISKIADRCCYNFVDRKLHKMGAWTSFGDPVFLE